NDSDLSSLNAPSYEGRKQSPSSTARSRLGSGAFSKRTPLNGQRSLAPAKPRASQCSHPTTSGIAGSASCTVRDAAGRRSDGSSGNEKLSITADTYTHVLNDGREVNYEQERLSPGGPIAKPAANQPVSLDPRVSISSTAVSCWCPGSEPSVSV